MARHAQSLALDVPPERVPVEELVRLHGDVLQRGNSLARRAARKRDGRGAPARARRLWNRRAPSAAAAAAAAAASAGAAGSGGDAAATAGGGARGASPAVALRVAAACVPAGGTQSFLCTGLCFLWHCLSSSTSDPPQRGRSSWRRREPPGVGATSRLPSLFRCMRSVHRERRRGRIRALGRRRLLTASRARGKHDDGGNRGDGKHDQSRTGGRTVRPRVLVRSPRPRVRRRLRRLLLRCFGCLLRGPRTWNRNLFLLLLPLRELLREQRVQLFVGEIFEVVNLGGVAPFASARG